MLWDSKVYCLACEGKTNFKVQINSKLISRANMFFNTILTVTQNFAFYRPVKMHDVIKTKGHGSILDFTSQTALRCEISSKTECKVVWDVKSRMDPCLSHNSHGSKLLNSAKFMRLARHRKSEILRNMLTCLLWMKWFTKGTETFYMHFTFNSKYISCIANYSCIPFQTDWL